MDETLNQALSLRFPPELKDTPYPDDVAYVADLLSWLSLYIGVAAAWQSAAKAGGGASAGALSGGAMEPDQAADYLVEYPAALERPQPEVTALADAAWACVAARLKAGEKAGLVPRLERLRQRLSLSDFAFFCVVCALASARDRAFERAFVSLHGNLEVLAPTLGVAQSVYRLARPVPEGAAAALLDPSSPESALLFRPAPAGKPPLLRPLVLRPAVRAWLLGQPYLGAALADHGTPIEPGTPPALMHLDTQLAMARAAFATPAAGGQSRMVILCGRAGSGKKSTLAAMAAQLGRRFLVLRPEELAWEADPDALIGELLGLGLLQGVTVGLAWDRQPTLAPEVLRLLAALRRHGLDVALLVGELRVNIVLEGWLVTRVDYKTPGLGQALDFWRHFGAEYQGRLAPGVDFAQLASKYVLSPGQIKNALLMAADMAAAADAPLDAPKLDRAILLGNTGRLSEIADAIDAFYTWDDLVLDDIPKGQLRDVCNRVKLRAVVEEQWGFLRKSAYGNGLSILLYGPPGTGKTMSAQVLAAELGLPLFRINLAQIISKYIGETAKNLDAIFNEARTSNVVLFFDEADALFAKRTDVKNSNDRHANSESSYLLQKIEEYSGVSILATNLVHNFDEAFRRRINYMINIHMPSPKQRLALWQGMLPPKAPLDADIDLAVLADGLDFSGSVIKAAALQAAYFAAEEQAPIAMRHLVRAIRLELTKLGKSEPHFLSAYPDERR